MSSDDLADRPVSPTTNPHMPRFGAEVESERFMPPGVRTLRRWVRLCENQGTRLVDTLVAWKDEHKRANDIAERHVAALERIADAKERENG